MCNLIKCRLCESTKVILRLEFNNMPMFLWPVSQKLFDKQNHDLCVFVCTVCGHAQIQNLTEEFLDQLYKYDYINLDSPRVNQIRANILRSFYQFDERNILDVGGATNSTYDLFTDSNYSILDPQKPLSSEVIHINGFISTTELKQEYYDYIFAFHIIEHLENPREDLSKLRKSLRSKGKLIIEVPDAEYYSTNLPFYLYFHQHINLFTQNSLQYLLNLSGFKRIENMICNGRILAVFEKNSSVRLNIKYRKVEPDFVYKRNSDFFAKLEDSLLQILDKNSSCNLDFLGAGGSSTLFFYHCPGILSKVRNIYDGDIRKVGSNLPGTKIKILETPTKFESDTVYMGMGGIMLEQWESYGSCNFVDILEVVRELET